MAQECSALAKHYSTFTCLSQDKVFIIFIFDRLIHQPSIILFYMTNSLLRHHLSQVARPLSSSGVTFGEPTLGGSVIVRLRSTDLPMALSSPDSGQWISLQPRHHRHQVARPPSGFVVTIVRSRDLPGDPSSSSSGR
jgi:hypothetical protein